MCRRSIERSASQHCMLLWHGAGKGWAQSTHAHTGLHGFRCAREILVNVWPQVINVTPSSSAIIQQLQVVSARVTHLCSTVW